MPLNRNVLILPEFFSFYCKSKPQWATLAENVCLRCVVYRCLSLQPDLDLETKQSHFDSQLLNTNEQRLLHEKNATKTLLARSIPLIRSFVFAVCMLKVQCDCS